MSIETQRIETLTKWVANRDKRITTLLAVIEQCEVALQQISDDWSTSKNPDWDGMCVAVARSRQALAAIRKVKEGK